MMLANAQRVRWYLADEKENIICFYDDDVQDDRTVRAYLPHSYLNKIKANEWKIFVETIASCFR